MVVLFKKGRKVGGKFVWAQVQLGLVEVGLGWYSGEWQGWMYWAIIRCGNKDGDVCNGIKEFWLGRILGSKTVGMGKVCDMRKNIWI